MEEKTNGYYARDWSLWLGWNNMRYIIEASLLHSRLLNRTLLIPSFVYARACEYDVAVCADYAQQVNRGDATHKDEWRHLPLNEQAAWRVPISLMFNLTHLRETHSVMLISEYLRLHGLSPELEASDGQWDQKGYHQEVAGYKAPSLHVIANKEFDEKISRVDMIPDDMRHRGGWQADSGWKDNMKSPAYMSLEAVLPQEDTKRFLDLSTAKRIVETEAHMQISTDEELVTALRENGWEVLYTYEGAQGMEYVQNVVNPTLHAVPRDIIRGFQEDFGKFTADVVLLKGEVHNGRTPGSMRFTSSQGRASHTDLVLHRMKPTDKVLELATLLDSRMSEKTEGRMWMGAHMRRGDFIRVQWVMAYSFEQHLSRIKAGLGRGRDVLGSLNESNLQPYGVPDVEADRSILQLKPPRPDDKFYLATDERDSRNLGIARERGAVLVSDLLNIEDRRRFGWHLMLTDVLGLVEQAALARGSFFYAHAMSSVAGGAINMRAARGADRRTATLEK
ncbi:hypothetical protein HYDPIDRAFT_84420 [Hydnomerulius pinastri MD-312]|nr:hypothetical protein HYDPIDRAFT_84420 [Hydnomerulius pinastri MD-312]